jgi:hypothetical protein
VLISAFKVLLEAFESPQGSLRTVLHLARDFRTNGVPNDEKKRTSEHTDDKESRHK